MSDARHNRRCGVCRHPRRREIETEYLSWQSPTKICRAFGIRSRSTLALHVRANRLDEKRNRDIRGLIIGFLERGLGLKPSPAAFVQAIAILARLDVSGRMVDKVQIEKHEVNPVFERMSAKELLRFAEQGELPDWLTPEERAFLIGTPAG